MLSTLMSLRHELRELRDVSIHLASPRLPRVTARRRDDSSSGTSVLARALARALPPSIVALAADLRGGGLLSGDIALADFSSAIPRGLVRLRLDLNQCSAREVRSVAAVLPETLKELHLLFHGRRLSWLGAPPLQDDGLDALAAALPRCLERLALRVECGDGGAGALCRALPATVKNLDLDLRILMPAPRGTPAQLPQGLVHAMAFSQLLSLRLRLIGWALTMESAKVVLSALPRFLQDLRLDLTGRNVGDDGASLLAESLPLSLTHLALCLRGWQLTDAGLETLTRGLAQSAASAQRLMLLLSGCSIGPEGADLLAQAMPEKLDVLNLCIKLSDPKKGGSAALQSLAERWNSKTGSWVRLDGNGAGGGSQDDDAEWAEWDELDTATAEVS